MSEKEPRNLLEAAQQGMEMSHIERRALCIQETLEKLSRQIDGFINCGGQVNLRVHHNGGSESIDLHQLNGEFVAELQQVAIISHFQVPKE